MQTFVIKLISKSAPIIFLYYVYHEALQSCLSTSTGGGGAGTGMVRVASNWHGGITSSTSEESQELSYGKRQRVMEEENYDSAIGVFVLGTRIRSSGVFGMTGWGPFRVPQNGIA